MEAQILTGKVLDEEGNGLSYATIWIEEMRLGTATNLDGEYQLQVALGEYQMTVKYLGYQSKTFPIKIEAGSQSKDIVLQQEVFSLQQVEVSGDMEDPAFTIMRRAIAKADFHRNQVDGYKVEVYLKGTGRLKGVPRLFRRRILRELKEEGIDTSTAFVSESVSEVNYERPNTYHEVVKSIYTQGNDFESSPNSFIQASFYEPEIAKAISPLSPKAFAYYEFEYQGFFSEGEHVINKIKVTPRSQGDHVFEGMLYIVDQDWSIHSLEFTTYLLGIRFDLNHVYQPIEPHVWMPINQVYDVSGKVFGFSFEGQYLANFGDYDITLNPDLEYTFEVIDAKLEREKAMNLDRKARKEKLEEDPLLGISTQEELTPKTLRKMMRSYEKDEREQRTDTMINVVGVQSQIIDSLATKRDSTYWAQIRPVPLSTFEVKGYDYLAQVDSSEQDLNKADSSNVDSVTITLSNNGSSVDIYRKGKFKWHHLITGQQYKLSEKASLRWIGPLTNTHVNTVEGFNSEVGLEYGRKVSKRWRWNASGQLHYGFSNELLLGKGAIEVSSREASKTWNLRLEGGSDMVQINPLNPIHERFNDVTTLLLEQNFMKLLRQTSYTATMTGRKGPAWSWSAKVGVYEKSQVYNQWLGTLINYRNRSYTSNEPINNEIGATSFGPYNSVELDLRARARPWLKYEMNNGRRYAKHGSSPELEVGLRQVFLDMEGGTQNYFRGELGIEHSWDLGARGILSLSTVVGKYWGAEEIPFPEFKHFAANLTPFVSADPTRTYRLLEYYSFSTSQEYLSLFTHFQFRKFFLTRFHRMRLKGIREALFVNWLETPTSNHYAELGYSINYIFRFFRLEFITSWQDLKYRDWGIRIGVAANLENIFSF